uniref:Uncharacterized protein n=1 Tax=Anopheles culicifacies TaxID=139723 RepID=A0A182M5S7_9DIPT
MIIFHMPVRSVWNMWGGGPPFLPPFPPPPCELPPSVPLSSSLASDSSSGLPSGRFTWFRLLMLLVLLFVLLELTAVDGLPDFSDLVTLSTTEPGDSFGEISVLPLLPSFAPLPLPPPPAVLKS